MKTRLFLHLRGITNDTETEDTALKKRVIILILLFILTVSFACRAELPSIDDVLAHFDSYSGSVEVSDDLSAYYWENQGDIDYGSLRFVILEREAPEKEFTALDSGYPDAMIDGFPDGFSGFDVGSPAIRVRCDLMAKLPAMFRAASLAEADILLVAENIYLLDSTLIVTDYVKNSSSEIPEFETLEELAAYLKANKPVIDTITYYPTFGSLTMVNLYDRNRYAALYDYTYTEGMVFAQNPEAAGQWSNMQDVFEIMTELSNGADGAGLNEQIAALEFLPQSKSKIWQACVSENEYGSAFNLIDEYYWEMARTLSSLDPSDENRELYSQIIDAKSYETLSLFVSFCNYTGFDRPISSIEAAKDYLTSSDWEWAEAAVMDVVNLLGGL